MEGLLLETGSGIIAPSFKTLAWKNHPPVRHHGEHFQAALNAVVADCTLNPLFVFSTLAPWFMAVRDPSVGVLETLVHLFAPCYKGSCFSVVRRI